MIARFRPATKRWKQSDGIKVLRRGRSQPGAVPSDHCAQSCCRRSQKNLAAQHVHLASQLSHDEHSRQLHCRLGCLDLVAYKHVTVSYSSSTSSNAMASGFEGSSGFPVPLPPTGPVLAATKPMGARTSLSRAAMASVPSSVPSIFGCCRLGELLSAPPIPNGRYQMIDSW